MNLLWLTLLFASSHRIGHSVRKTASYKNQRFIVVLQGLPELTVKNTGFIYIFLNFWLLHVLGALFHFWSHLFISIVFYRNNIMQYIKKLKACPSTQVISL